MPESKSGAAEIMKGAGTTLEAYGQYKDAYAAAQAEYFNADMLEMQALDVLSIGDLEAERARKEGVQVAAAQNVGYAGQNVDVTMGTPAKLVEQTGIESEKNARLIKLDAARKAWGMRAQAAQKRHEADQMRSAGRRRGYSTLIGGIGQQMGG
jgi:hypothetical protein